MTRSRAFSMSSAVAAEERSTCPCRRCSGKQASLIHGTTRRLNAVLTGTTARTAFLTTAWPPGHSRAARGRSYRHLRSHAPLPRSLRPAIPDLRGAGTYRLPRARSSAARRGTRCSTSSAAFASLGGRGGRCLPAMVDRQPGTRAPRGRAPRRAAARALRSRLSHQLNPCLREYRRASSACIDASLKPVMTEYLERASNARLSSAGLRRTLA